MRFAYPWLLLLAIPAIMLLLLALRRRPPTLGLSSLRHFTGGDGSRHASFASHYLPPLLESLAALLLVCAIARPQLSSAPQLREEEGLDIMMALDISKSMEFYDPPNAIADDQRALMTAIRSKELLPRHEHAKKQLDAFVRMRPQDRLGLVVFSGEAYCACPPTSDHPYLLQQIARLKPGALGPYNQGTNIVSALAASISRLAKTPSKRKILILVTDGAHNVPADITPEMAAKAAVSSGAVIYTIAIGSSRAVSLQQTFFGSELVPVNEEFDASLLQRLATLSNGQCFRVDDAAQMDKVMGQIDSIEKSRQTRTYDIRYTDLHPWFLWPAAILAFLSLLLSQTILQRFP